MDKMTEAALTLKAAREKWEAAEAESERARAAAANALTELTKARAAFDARKRQWFESL